MYSGNLKNPFIKSIHYTFSSYAYVYPNGHREHGASRHDIFWQSEESLHKEYTYTPPPTTHNYTPLITHMHIYLCVYVYCSSHREHGATRHVLAVRPRSFLEAGFRPLCPPFVYFVPLSRTNPAFWISTRTAPGPINQVLPGCRVRHPQYFKKFFVRLLSISHNLTRLRSFSLLVPTF